MEESVWSIEEAVEIELPNGEVVRKTGEITAEAIKEVARNAGVKKFTVEKDGELLTPEDFPITSGRVSIKEYNEAK
jgi:hypothetical protein